MSKHNQAVDHIKIGNPKPRRSANRLRLMAGASFVVALSCLHAAPASAAVCSLSTPSTWNIAGNGNWSTAADWNPAGAPNSAATNVCITNGTSTVALNSSFTVGNLQLASGNTLSFNPGTSLVVGGTQIVNSGAITVNGGAGTNAFIFVGNDMSLSGGGTVTLNVAGGGGSAYLRPSGSWTLTNVDNTIQGAGNIGDVGGLTILNQGTIVANSAGQLLDFNQGNGGVTNTGLLKATNTGILELFNPITNTGGNITADNGTVNLKSATITGGTLNTLNGGTIQNVTSTTLDGVTISTGSTFTGAAGSTTFLANTITNKGAIQLNGGGGTNAILFTNGGVTLQGGGTLTLSVAGGGGSAFIRANGTSTLTNVNNTIQGSGIIGDTGGLTILNQSTIVANAAGQVLNLNLGNGGITNTGLLKATNTGTLQLSNTITNTGANITADNGTVNLTNATITGGTLNALNGGAIQNINSATLDGVTISTGSTFTGTAGSSTFLTNTITNNSAIQINGGAGTNAILYTNGNVMLQGGGTVTLSVAGGGGSAFLRDNTAGTLTNVDNLIQGAGNIGDTGGLAILNQSTIVANAAGQTLNLNAGNGGVTNSGLLKATNTGTLQIFNTVDNTGHNITADNGLVALNNATITGGTLNTLNGGAIQNVNNAHLDGVTISTGSTVTGNIGSSTFLANTITNNGAIQINGGGGTNAFLYTNGDVTLQGGGTVTLSVAGGGGFAYLRDNIGGTLTNVDNLIQGAGNIGDTGGLAILNQSTIVANAAGQTLNLNAGNGGVTNSGLLKATNTGTLQIFNTVDNTGHNITADNGLVALNNATITGGTLNTLNGGAIQNVNNTHLDGVTLSTGSTLEANPGTSTFLVNTITNRGTIQIDGAGGTNAFLYTNGNVTLQGGGTVTLSLLAGGGNLFLRDNSAGTLTNLDNTIQGAGNVGDTGGLAIVNGALGTIVANAAGQTLNLNAGNGGVTNNGTFAAAAGSTLHVAGTTFTNYSGNTLTGGTYQAFGTAIAPGTIQIDQLGNTGGEIHTNAATILLDGPNSKIVDSVGNDALSNLSANSGSFTVQNGRNYTTAGALANSGLVQAGNPAGGDAPSTLTLTGALTGTTGTLKINPNGNVIVGANSTTGTLTHNGSAPGSLALGTNTITVSTDYTNAHFGTGNGFNNHANVSGTGQINAAGNVNVSISGANITNGTTATPTLAFGNVHAGIPINANFNVNNTGNTGPVLRGAIQNTGLTNPVVNITAANFGPIALGGSQAETLTFAPIVGGSLAGQSFKVVTNFDNVQTQTVGVTGTAWNYAQATINTAQPVAFGNHHVNDVIGTQQAISITNSAPAAFSERLDASVSGTTGGVTTNGGSFGLLAAAATNNVAIKVGIDTSSAGNKAGQATLAFVSNGSGTSGLGTTALTSQNVNVTGAVYNLASSNVIAPINFGVVHVGTGIHTQTLSITNTAAAGAFSEGLDSSFGSYTNNGGTVNPAFAGSITNLTAGSNNNTSMVASLDTSTAGFVSGNITVHQASNGATTSGLGITALADQNPAVSGTVQATVTNLAQPIINNAQPISFGNVRIGTATTAQVVSVTNGAPSGGFSEGLIGSANGTTGTGITASGSFGSAGNSLAPQATNPPSPAGSGSISVNIDTSSAGAKSGNAVIDFKSDGTAFAGGAVTDLGNTNVAVQGNVYRLATGSAVNPADIGAARVGGTLSGNISVTNTAANDGFSEKLDASITATTPSVTGSSGNITGLAAGATNSSGLTVTLDTSTSGVTSGTATIQYKSNGTGIDGGAPINNGSQIVTINGKVYQTAVAAVTPGPINFGIVHVGDVVSAQSINVKNTASGFLVDSITGNIASVTGGAAGAFTHSGSLGAGVAAGGNSNALQVGLNTGTAGVFSGNANLALASHDVSLSDVALTTAPVLVQAQVNNFANGAFVSKGGAGAFSQAGSNFLLNFGTLVQGGTLTSNLAVLNNVLGPADNLSGVFSVPVLPADLTLSGFNSFQNLAAGSQFGGLQVNLDTSFTNFFDIFVTLSPTGSNASGFSGGLADITLELKGNIVAQNNKIPEPLTLSLFGTGVAGLFLRERRRKRKMAQA